jgi:hypothetical protein
MKKEKCSSKKEKEKCSSKKEREMQNYSIICRTKNIREVLACFVSSVSHFLFNYSFIFFRK